MISLTEVLDDIKANLIRLEWEFSWVEQGGHWNETLDEYPKMTEILRQTLKLHSVWTDSLESGQ